MSDIVTEGIISHPGGKLLYRNATGLEKAMADVDGERLIGTYAEIINDQWNPYKISYNNLPYLGYAMGVLLWEEGWSESTQREWIAHQFEYKSLRGTQAGIEMALHYSGRDFVGPQGYTVPQAIRPPQGFFASPSMSKEAYDFWIRLLPELRITFYEGVGWDGVDVLFCGDGGCNWHVGLDDGPSLYGRKAFLRIRGTDYPLEIYTFTKTINGVTSVDYERVAIPGLAGPAYLQGDFVNDEQFVCAETVVPKLVTLRIDGSYNHEQSQLHLDTVLPGMDPIDVRYERRSDVGWGNSFFFVGDWSDSRNILVPSVPVTGDGALMATSANLYNGILAVGGFGDLVAQPSGVFNVSPFYGDPIVFYADAGYDAARMLADRVFLYDPTIVGTITGGISFVGVDYVNWPAYTADLMIHLHADDGYWSWFADEGHTNDDNYFASKVEMDDFDRACRAVVTTQALRDRVRTAFDPTRLIELREYAWNETTVDQQVPNLL
jgi:Phage tail protein (Tail_P2_I)